MHLRDFRAADISPEYVGWLNDPQIVAYSRQRFYVHSLESCAAYAASFHGTSNRFIAIDDVASGKMVGTMTVYASLQHDTADVGILLGAAEVRGKGYGRDAWNTLLAFLLSSCRIRKVTAGTLSVNEPMCAILEQSVMHREAVLAGQELHGGCPVDVYKYAAFLSKVI